MSNGKSLIEAALAKHPTSSEVVMLATYTTETANALRFLRDAMLNKCGNFPLDQTNDNERLWRAAMLRAYELVGIPKHTPLDLTGAGQALQLQGRE